MSSIPDFTDKGVLPEGVHKCSGEEFIERFCVGESVRPDYESLVSNVFDFAKRRGVRNLFIGGSFVTNVDNPNDIDILMLFTKSSDIPEKSILTQNLIAGSGVVDLMYCLESDEIVRDAYIKLLTSSRFGSTISGLIQVDLYGDAKQWEINYCVDEDDYEVIKRAYFHRSISSIIKPKGVLITVHGLLSKASWNSEIMPIASSNGWVVAPYYYDGSPILLLSKKRRSYELDKFRNWLYEVSSKYAIGDLSVSAIAHSFGTYLIGAYFDGFDDDLPVAFDTVILTGSILDSEYDWSSKIGSHVGVVRNEVAPNDQWVKLLKEDGFISSKILSRLFGQSGVISFSKLEKIYQPENKIFDHNNVIQRDVISSHWMPFLNAHRGALIRASSIKNLQK